MFGIVEFRSDCGGLLTSNFHQGELYELTYLIMVALTNNNGHIHCIDVLGNGHLDYEIVCFLVDGHRTYWSWHMNFKAIKFQLGSLSGQECEF